MHGATQTRIGLWSHILPSQTLYLIFFLIEIHHFYSPRMLSFSSTSGVTDGVLLSSAVLFEPLNATHQELLSARWHENVSIMETTTEERTPRRTVGSNSARLCPLLFRSLLWHSRRERDFLHGLQSNTCTGLPCMKWNDPSVLFYGVAVDGQANWDHNLCRTVNGEQYVRWTYSMFLGAPFSTVNLVFRPAFRRRPLAVLAACQSVPTRPLISNSRPI